MKKLILILLTFCVIQADSNLNNELLEKFNKLTKQEIIIGSTIIASSIIVWRLFKKPKSYSYNNEHVIEPDLINELDLEDQVLYRKVQDSHDIVTHKDHCFFGITGVCVCS